MVNSPSSAPIKRAISVLKCYISDDSELSASELCARTGIAKATMHRMLQAFVEDGILERRAGTGKYAVGPLLFQLGGQYMGATDLVRASSPVVQELNLLTNELVNVGVLTDGQVSSVLKEDSRDRLRYTFPVGTAVPAYASSRGQVILSDLTDTELDARYPEEDLKPRTPKTIATKTELKRVLAQIRADGAAVNLQGSHPDVGAVGAPVRDQSGRVVAAISIAIPIFRLDRVNMDDMVALVKLAADAISYRLGAKPPGEGARDISDIRKEWERIQATAEQ
ncbi:IclR family transcriptional regulator [Chloroflexota bacterium]